MKYRIQNIE